MFVNKSVPTTLAASRAVVPVAILSILQMLPDVKVLLSVLFVSFNWKTAGKLI